MQHLFSPLPQMRSNLKYYFKTKLVIRVIILTACVLYSAVASLRRTGGTSSSNGGAHYESQINLPPGRGSFAWSTGGLKTSTGGLSPLLPLLGYGPVCTAPMGELYQL